MDNVRRHMNLTRYAKGLQQEYRVVMGAVDERYLTRARKILDAMTERDKLAFQQNRKTKRTISLRKALDQWAAEYRDHLRPAMSEGYTGAEAVEYKATEGTGEKLPKLVLGATITSIAATSALRFRKDLDTTTKTAFADGEDAYLRIAGTQQLKTRDGRLWQRIKAETQHIMDAVLNGGINGRARAWKHRGEVDLVWWATLDGTTCMICASRDGVMYDKWTDVPQIPAHPICRCVIVEEKGAKTTRGAVAGKRKKGPRGGTITALEDARKHGKDSYTVASTTKFPAWFAKQDARFQREWLGPSRFKLYETGKYPVTKFVDPRRGRVYTLEDLENMK